MVKNLPAMWKTWVQTLGWDLLEKGMATHSSILAWRSPWTEEPGGLQSMGSQTVRHDWVINTWLNNGIPWTVMASVGLGTRTKYRWPRQGDLYNRRLFFQVLGVGHPRSGSQRVMFWWTLLSWTLDGRLLAVPSHGEGNSVLSPVCPSQGTGLITRDPPLEPHPAPVASPRPHLLMSSHWGWGFNIWIVGGVTKVRSTTVTAWGKSWRIQAEWSTL